MSNQSKNNLDISKLTESIETLSSLSNCLNNVDLSDNFEEIEEYLINQNFEHGNFYTNYKSNIEDIMSNLDEIKLKINKLNDSVSQTVNSFSNVENLTDSDIKQIGETYNYSEVSDKLANTINTNSTNISFRNTSLNNLKTSLSGVADETTGNITQIPTPEVEQEPVTTTTSTQINTVPIGLGIAATGISASIGAVVVDSMNSKKRKTLDSTLEAYEDFDSPQVKNVYTEEEIKKQPVEEAFANKQTKIEEVLPYHAASRDKSALEKFYGTDTSDYNNNDD